MDEVCPPKSQSVSTWRNLYDDDEYNLNNYTLPFEILYIYSRLKPSPKLFSWIKSFLNYDVSEKIENVNQNKINNLRNALHSILPSFEYIESEIIAKRPNVLVEPKPSGEFEYISLNPFKSGVQNIKSIFNNSENLIFTDWPMYPNLCDYTYNYFIYTFGNEIILSELIDFLKNINDKKESNLIDNLRLLLRPREHQEAPFTFLETLISMSNKNMEEFDTNLANGNTPDTIARPLVNIYKNCDGFSHLKSIVPENGLRLDKLNVCMYQAIRWYNFFDTYTYNKIEIVDGILKFTRKYKHISHSPLSGELKNLHKLVLSRCSLFQIKLIFKIYKFTTRLVDEMKEKYYLGSPDIVFLYKCYQNYILGDTNDLSTGFEYIRTLPTKEKITNDDFINLVFKPVTTKPNINQTLEMLRGFSDNYAGACNFAIDKQISEYELVYVFNKTKLPEIRHLILKVLMVITKSMYTKALLYFIGDNYPTTLDLNSYNEPPIKDFVQDSAKLKEIIEEYILSGRITAFPQVIERAILYLCEQDTNNSYLITAYNGITKGVLGEDEIDNPKGSMG